MVVFICWFSSVVACCGTTYFLHKPPSNGVPIRRTVHSMLSAQAPLKRGRYQPHRPQLSGVLLSALMPFPAFFMTIKMLQINLLPSVVWSLPFWSFHLSSLWDTVCTHIRNISAGNSKPSRVLPLKTFFFFSLSLSFFFFIFFPFFFFFFSVSQIRLDGGRYCCLHY